MSLQSLPNAVLLSNFRSLVHEERRISREVLEYIAEIETRRLFADEGFSSTHEWLVGKHGYSHASASRRVSAARMLCAVPEAATKIETGELCMTTLSRVQSAIRDEEKRSGEVMTSEQKREVLCEIEAKPKVQIDHALAEIFQVVASKREITQMKSGGETRTHLTFTAEQMRKIKRAAELLSHRLDRQGGDHSLAGVIEAMADVVIAQEDPLVKVVKPPTRKSSVVKEAEPSENSNLKERLSDHEDNARQSRSGVGSEKVGAIQIKELSPSTRNAIYRRDNGCCQFETSDGVKCGSRKFTQIDHIIPRALGGTNDIENLRVLCRTHNLLMAERVFGREKVATFRK